MMITADHESVVMQQIRRERFRQFCEGFGSLRSPCRYRHPALPVGSESSTMAKERSAG